MASKEATVSGKKRKYDTRFPVARIKKIMQTDQSIGKVAHGVPIVLSKAVEMFLDHLLRKTAYINRSQNTKYIGTIELKNCIFSHPEYFFLRDLVNDLPNSSANDGPPPF